VRLAGGRKAEKEVDFSSLGRWAARKESRGEEKLASSGGRRLGVRLEEAAKLVAGKNWPGFTSI